MSRASNAATNGATKLAAKSASHGSRAPRTAGAMRGCALLIVAAGAVAGAMTATTSGCTIVNGLVADAPDTGVDGGPTTDAGVDAPVVDDCARPPPRPTIPDDGVKTRIVVVARRFVLAPPPDAPPFGFDLDDTCKARSSETCVGRQKKDDGLGGIDNNAGALFTVANGSTDLEQRINAGILEGNNTILLELGEYNGKRDDPAVVVSVYASLGLYDAAGKMKKPDFVEAEAWTLDDRQFNPITNLPVSTVAGYVANGKLVAAASASLAISESFAVTVAGGTLTADLDFSGAKPTITGGMIGGRWPATDMLRSISRLSTRDAGNAALCQPGQEQVFAFARSAVCDNLDIMSDRTKDNRGLACDATSVAIQFFTAPASLGKRETPVVDDPCPDFDAGSCAP